MSVTYIERADTPQELRDKFVAWLRDHQHRAERRALRATRKSEREKEVREFATYRDTADFWERVVIEPNKPPRAEPSEADLLAGSTSQ